MFAKECADQEVKIDSQRQVVRIKDARLAEAESALAGRETVQLEAVLAGAMTLFGI